MRQRTLQRQRRRPQAGTRKAPHAAPGSPARTPGQSKAAPAAAMEVPSNVMPPETPLGTCRSVRIDTGSCRESSPTSLAQVSAFEEAKDTANPSAQAGFPVNRKHSAHTAPTPPFARTWNASLRLPFWWIFFSGSFCAAPMELSTVEEMKKAISRTQNSGPPKAKITVPTTRRRRHHQGPQNRAKAPVPRPPCSAPTRGSGPATGSRENPRVQRGHGQRHGDNGQRAGRNRWRSPGAERLV